MDRGGSLLREAAPKSPEKFDEEKLRLSRPSRGRPLQHGLVIAGHKSVFPFRAKNELRWYRGTPVVLMWDEACFYLT